ncbi:MAG TPA: phenylalanine--tRNA ligase subunit beta [Candidatus Moranbacteria bacterium]|nr:phenylalanine--tRNA ligase subunit beta [Candidatus Moranbacteria bacterium]
MKYSYDWLKKISGTTKSPQQLADLLTMSAFEVEGIEKIKKDTFIDIDVLANRGHDALSHVGMAREIAALEGKKLKYDFPKLVSKKSGQLKVEIKDNDLCSRYIGVMIENVEIKDSPQWMKDLFEVYGINSINNIVDATNYVMLELGQPMHAFDVDKLTTNNQKLTTIAVRRAKSKEKIKLLDGDEKELSKNDLVIADSSKALAIAGIKGGEDAGITNNTKTIILESANFNATNIRKSRTRLGLKTDSSDRFEKEIDPNLTEIAMARLIELLGGKVIDVVDNYPNKVSPWKISLDLNYVNKLLGENIPSKEVIKILNSLELKTTPHLYPPLTKGRKKGGVVTIEIPTFRIDLKTQEDLIEEIGRIYGYENISSQMPVAHVKPANVNENRLFEREVKNILAGNGFSEVYNYSFYSARDAGLAQLGSIKHLELENPMNPDQEWLRISLIPNILKNVRENLKNFDEFNIFEIGKVYWPNKSVLPEEKNILVGAVVIKTKKSKKATEFYTAKGYIDASLQKLGISDHYYDDFNASPVDTFTPTPKGNGSKTLVRGFITLWHQGRSAEIKIKRGGKEIGYVGEINPLILTELDIHQRVAMFEIDMTKLKEVSESEMEYKPISKYPTIERDISMIANENVRVDDILANLQAFGGNLVLDVDLFDIYDFENNTSSYAFHIIFGADDRTLQSEEVDKLMKKITSNLEKDLGVKIRK